MRNDYQEFSRGWSKEGPVRKADSLTAICEPIAQKMWESLTLTTLWAFTTCYSDIFTFTFIITMTGAIMYS
jgi:hypothetical protein